MQPVIANPYEPPRAAAGSPESGRSSRRLKLLGAAFAIYTIVGHVVFYGRVADTYARLGPAGVELYYLSSLVLLFLSFFGAACVVATSAYTFRRMHFRPVIGILIALTVLALGGSVAAFFTLEEYWVRGVVFLFTRG